MDKKLHKTFIEQINHELYSSYLYLAMAAYSESIDLPGFAKWLQAQAKEETAHGMKMFEFLIERGERVELGAIAKPPVDFGAALDIFKAVLAHEKKVTGLIHNLYSVAQKADDPAAAIFMQWFVTEQVEEEKHANEIIALLQRIKPDSGQILMIDHQLGKRE
jgi:ferritin